MSDKSTVTTIDDEVVQAPSTKPQHVNSSVSDPDFTGDKVEVTINQGQGVEGKQAVFLNVNSSSYHIPRGVKVIIPAEAFHALENAVQDTYEADEKGEVQVRQVHRFPFQAHRTILAADAEKAEAKATPKAKR